jgi:hypothetical protein
MFLNVTIWQGTTETSYFVKRTPLMSYEILLHSIFESAADNEIFLYITGYFAILYILFIIDSFYK